MPRLLNCVGKTALKLLNQFILVWEKVNDVEARFSLLRTPLCNITSLTAHTTTAMSGEFGGFQALFEQARLGGWRQDGCIGNYKPSTGEEEEKIVRAVKAAGIKATGSNGEHLQKYGLSRDAYCQMMEALGMETPLTVVLCSRMREF